jgi:hypothetical protein
MSLFCSFTFPVKSHSQEFGINIVGEDNNTIIHHKVPGSVIWVFSEQDAHVTPPRRTAPAPTPATAALTTLMGAMNDIHDTLGVFLVRIPSAILFQHWLIVLVAIKSIILRTSSSSRLTLHPKSRSTRTVDVSPWTSHRLRFQLHDTRSALATHR